MGRAIEFPPFEFDLDGERLLRDGREVPLRPRTSALLRYMLQNPGRLLEREELIAAVWPDAKVTPALLKNRVGDLRKALGDDAGSPRIVETVPHRGYRFVAEATSSGNPRTVQGFGARPAIAVLPFDCPGTSGDPELLAEGLAEDLIARLSSWRSFPVIARASTLAYRGRDVPLRQIGQELGIRYGVTGSVRRDGKRLRVTVQLADAESDQQLWAERYDREFSNLFELQDEITQAIVAAIHPELDRAETGRVVRRDAQSLDAWESTHRGWWHLFAPESDNAESRSCFERAIELDPTFAYAWYGLAMTHYNDLIDQTTPDAERSISELQRAAERAMSLDDQEPGSHVAVGAAYTVLGRREEACSRLETAVALNPSFSRAHYWLGFVRILAGRADEGIEALEKGLRLSPRDPLSWVFFQLIGLGHFAAKRVDAAASWARRAVERRPEGAVARLVLATSLIELGRSEEAHEQIEELLRVRPRFSLSSIRPVLSVAEPDLRDRLLGGVADAGLSG